MTNYKSLAPELFSPVRSEDNKTELFNDGPECLAMLLREIKKAKHYIHFQVMLFYSDEAGFKVARALAEKSKEGVDVRVMSDSGMSKLVRLIEKFRSSGTSDFSDLKQLFTQSGVKFVASDKESYRLYNWPKKRIELKKKGVPEKFLIMQDAIQKGILINASVLDHRKLLVFDGERAVVTGLNIGNKYLYEQQPGEEEQAPGEYWHDGAVLIHGPCASVLNRQFASKWMVRGGDVFEYHKHFRTKEKYGTDVCTIYGFFPGMEENHIRNYYLKKIQECQGKLILENPYINDDIFWEKLSNLEEAQAEKISIINPYKAKGNDYFQNTSAIRCKMWKPAKKGVSFYAFNKRMTHWKIALDLANSEVFMGSYNLNNRSAFHDFELNVLVESKELAQKVKEMLDYDMSQSTKITNADEFYKNPKRHLSCFLLNMTEYFT